MQNEDRSWKSDALKLYKMFSLDCKSSQVLMFEINIPSAYMLQFGRAAAAQAEVVVQLYIICPKKKQKTGETNSEVMFLRQLDLKSWKVQNSSTSHS